MSKTESHEYVKTRFAYAELENAPKELETTYAQAEDMFHELIRQEREDAFTEGVRHVLDSQMRLHAKGIMHMRENMFTNPYREDS